jgi:hypothetical protein
MRNDSPRRPAQTFLFARFSTQFQLLALEQGKRTTNGNLQL